MTGQLAFVESPVQLLNVLEWAHTQNRVAGSRAAGAERVGTADGALAAPGLPAPAAPTGVAPSTGDPADAGPADAAPPLTVVVLSPTDPMSRGQLRRMADRKSVV